MGDVHFGFVKRLVIVRRLYQGHVVAKFGGALRAFDRLGGGFRARTRDQELPRSRRFLYRDEDGFDFLAREQHGFPRGTIRDVARKARGVVLPNVVLNVLYGNGAVSSIRRSERREYT